MISPITSKQRQVYDYIVDCRRQIGVSPTLSEVAEAFQVTKTTTRHHITHLVESGWLTRTPGKQAAVMPSIEAIALNQLPAMIKLLVRLRDSVSHDTRLLQAQAGLILEEIE